MEDPRWTILEDFCFRPDFLHWLPHPNVLGEERIPIQKCVVAGSAVAGFVTNGRLVNLRT
jgi:hypothetical protein